jgi:hypothetical protein
MTMRSAASSTRTHSSRSAPRHPHFPDDPAGRPLPCVDDVVVAVVLAQVHVVGCASAASSIGPRAIVMC